jgi:hypothetical protein
LPAASPPPPPPPPPLLTISKAEDPEARSHRLARIASENEKKKKIENKGFQFGFAKNGAIGIKLNNGKVVHAFAEDSDDEQGGVSPIASSSSSTNIVENNPPFEVNEARLDEIRQTALWLYSNPEYEVQFFVRK